MLLDETTPCFGKWNLFDSTEVADHREAVKLCADCPARAACADLLVDVINTHASYGGPVGTWAGKGFGIGRKVGRPPTKKQRRSASDIPDCGTESAYARHRNRKEDCLPCRSAHADVMREKRRLKAEAKWAEGETA